MGLSENTSAKLEIQVGMGCSTGFSFWVISVEMVTLAISV